MSTCCFLQVCPRRLRGRLRELLFRVLLSGSVMISSHSRQLINSSTHQPININFKHLFHSHRVDLQNFSVNFSTFSGIFLSSFTFRTQQEHPAIAPHHGTHEWHTTMVSSHGTLAMPFHHGIAHKWHPNMAPSGTTPFAKVATKPLPLLEVGTPAALATKRKKHGKHEAERHWHHSHHLPSFLPSMFDCLIACLLAGWLAGLLAAWLAGCLVSLLACLISWNTKLGKKNTKNRVPLTPPCLICCRFISCCNQHGNLD